MPGLENVCMVSQNGEGDACARTELVVRSRVLPIQIQRASDISARDRHQPDGRSRGSGRRVGRRASIAKASVIPASREPDARSIAGTSRRRPAKSGEMQHSRNVMAVALSGVVFAADRGSGRRRLPDSHTASRCLGRMRGTSFCSRVRGCERRRRRPLNPLLTPGSRRHAV